MNEDVVHGTDNFRMDNWCREGSANVEQRETTTSIRSTRRSGWNSWHSWRRGRDAYRVVRRGLCRTAATAARSSSVESSWDQPRMCCSSRERSDAEVGRTIGGGSGVEGRRDRRRRDDDVVVRGRTRGPRRNAAEGFQPPPRRWLSQRLPRLPWLAYESEARFSSTGEIGSRSHQLAPRNAHNAGRQGSRGIVRDPAIAQLTLPLSLSLSLFLTLSRAARWPP